MTQDPLQAVAVDLEAERRFKFLGEKWTARLDGVTCLGERTLFVSAVEYREIMEMEELRVRLEPPEVTREREYRDMLMIGAIDNFLSTPIVIDVENADRQRSLILEGARRAR